MMSPLNHVVWPGVCAAALLGPVFSASAQVYKLTVNPATSALNGTVGVSVRFAGTLTGNYVQGTNESGTRTVAGLFGSTAAPRNDAIAISGTGGTPTPAPTVQTAPIGTYYLKINQSAGLVSLYGLNANMIGSSPQPQLPVSISVTYSSFRTIAPNYTYIWLGIPVPVSLGNGTITSMTLLQDAPVNGVLTPTGPSTYSFSLAVPVTLSTSILLQGNTSSNVSPTTITINGTVTAVDTAPAGIAASLAIPMNITQTLPPAAGVPTPFGLPSPTGAGADASVIMTADIVAPSSATTTGSATLPSNGVKLNPADIADDQGNAPPRADVVNNGVNEGDYNAFFAGYFSAAPWCDIADDAGHPFPPATPEVPNSGVNEGDYNLFFQVFFT